jgi:hypothetical protein
VCASWLVSVAVLLLLCASVWFLLLLLIVEECLTFKVKMLSGENYVAVSDVVAFVFIVPYVEIWYESSTFINACKLNHTESSTK